MRPNVGVLLAGGKSSRMGQDKSQLLYKGKKLIDHMAEVLNESLRSTSGVVRLVVSGVSEVYDSVPDRVAGAGPMMGLASSILHIKKTLKAANFQVVTVPIDMPLLQPQCLIRLMEEPAPGATLIKYRGFEMPFVLRVDDRVLQHFERIYSDETLGKGTSVRDFRNSLPFVELVPCEDETDCFANTNTPVEFERIIKK